MALSQPVVGIRADLKKENASLEELRNLHHQMDMGAPPIGEFHDTPCVGHGGVIKISRLSVYLWPGKRNVYRIELPLSLIPYPPGSSKVVDVEVLLVERDGLMQHLKQNLVEARNRMEVKANRNGEEAVTKLPEEFQEGQPLEKPMAICDSRARIRYSGATLIRFRAYQLVTAFLAQFDALRAELQATRGLLQIWQGAGVIRRRCYRNLSVGDASLHMKKISLHQMQALLDQDEIYEVYKIHSLVPTKLPPHRSIDHRIHFLPDTKPMNVRPNFYPHYQKGEMEKLVTEMLDQGIIRYSQSPFSSPVFLPDFNEVFVVEADASANGIGAVLLQNSQPISYFSHKLGLGMRLAAIYQKDLFAIVEAVYKWRQYLVGRRFIVRIDHKSIKELMQQVIQIPIQQKYVRKLMGFDFKVEYKSRILNQVADALSSMCEDEETVSASFMAFSQPVVGIIADLKKENASLKEMRNLLHQFDMGAASIGVRREKGLIIFQDRYYVGKETKLKKLLLEEFHDTPCAGHGGVKKY
ncbi:ty3-gypsy retrotransposon protein [Tanacetum coccineum]